MPAPPTHPLAARGTNAIMAWTREVLAGSLAALVVVAYAMSYSALMFPGRFAAGMPQALWAMLLGACLAGGLIAWRTTIPPLAGGLDNPHAAAMIALAGLVSAGVAARGGTPELAIAYTLLVLALATLVNGAAALAIGHFRLSRTVRLVPYSVVCGFMVATGWLLLAGGFKLAAGRPFALDAITQPFASGTWPRLATAVAVAALLIMARARIQTPFAVPAVIAAAIVVADLVLLRTYRTLPAIEGWFLPGLDRAAAWTPVGLWRTHMIDTAFLLSFAPEMLAIACVGIISTIVKVAGLETQRAVSADLDHEFRVSGLANLIVATAGGFASSILTSPTRLLTEAGGTRRSGIIAAGVVGAVLAFKIDVAGIVPLPVLGGLLIALGLTLIADNLRRILEQSDWASLAFALAVAVACVRYGYIAGVLLGFVGACLLFAVTYGRVGLIRRQTTRAAFASDVDHGPEANAILRAHGTAIQIYWLSGYMFFGSSDTMFERVRDSARPDVRFIVLDFAGITGADASAVISLVKLKNFADRRGTTLAFCAMDDTLRQALARDQVFDDGNLHRHFPALLEGLEWCELQLLRDASPATSMRLPADTASSNDADFIEWLMAEFKLTAAPDVHAGQVTRYFQRRAMTESCTLYEQGTPADRIDLVAGGIVTISVHTETGGERRLRRMCQRTVVGEMGFFRSGTRSATVSIEQAAILYTLSRESFDRMTHDDPALAVAFTAFIVRTLAGRLEFANTEIAALL